MSGSTPQLVKSPARLSPCLPYYRCTLYTQPVESKKKASKGVYVCPTYMYPLRTGSRERPSFVIAAELRAGKHPSEFWTKRGVAMLLSIAV